MAVRYKNKKSGSVSTYAQEIPRLEKSKDWDRVASATASSDGPAQSATKDEWAAYAQSQGVDTDGMTKDEIIAAVS